MIQFSCPNCKKVLKAPDDKAGVTVRCPQCKQQLTVPGQGLSPLGPESMGSPPPPPLPTPTVEQWFYSQKGQHHGPVTTKQLKQLAASGQLLPTDMVWKDGMQKWIEAGQTTGLFKNSLSQAISQSTTPPPFPLAQEKGGQDGLSKSNHLSLILGGCILVSLILTVIIPASFGTGRQSKHDRFGAVDAFDHVTGAERFKQYKQEQRERTGRWALLLPFLYLDFGLGLALGLSLYQRFRGHSSNDGQFSIWRRLWEYKVATLGLAFVAVLPLLFLFGNLYDTFGNPLFQILVYLVLLLLAGLLILFIIFGIMALIRAVNREKLFGKWNPIESKEMTLEFVQGGSFIRGDGFAGEFVFNDDDRTIDIRENNQVTAKWFVTKLDPWELIFKDQNGKVFRYKKESSGAAKFFKGLFTVTKEDERRWRLDRLLHKWDPVSGNGPEIQFTKDGAFIRFDGFAARYSFDGDPPNEIITIHVNDTEKIELKVLSLERDEMVLAGEGGSCHYKRGVSICTCPL